MMSGTPYSAILRVANAQVRHGHNQGRRYMKLPPSMSLCSGQKRLHGHPSWGL